MKDEDKRKQALADVKHVLANCKKGDEARAIMFAIQLNKITGVKLGE